MQDKRAKHKGRKGNASFLHIPHEVLNSDAYRSQDGWTAKLLVDLAGQFNGGNNGDLCAAWTIMREQGWRSKGTLHKSLNNLLEAGLIENLPGRIVENHLAPCQTRPVRKCEAGCFSLTKSRSIGTALAFGRGGARDR